MRDKLRLVVPMKPAGKARPRVTQQREVKGMKQIELRGGYVALVSACDFEWLNQWRWYRDGRGYACRSTVTENGHNRVVYMHREIINAKPRQQIDHIDRNRLNNTRANLRLATPAQNAWNRGMRSDNTSGYKGVSWCKRHGLWRSCIFVSGRQRHLGRFKDADDAARAYNEAALKYFGAFAVLNKVGSS